MSSTIEINLPKYIMDYVGAKARNNYIPEPIVVEQYVLKAVLEELVLKYHKEGYSYSKIAELTHSSVPKVLEILAEHNVEDELNDLEQDLKELGI